MAKKSMIEREKKRAKLVEKYATKLEALKEKFASPELTQQQKVAVHREIQQIPRNANPTRHRNRCWATGRPRGYYKDFGLCRNVLREMAHQGLLPGVVKSSWQFLGTKKPSPTGDGFFIALCAQTNHNKFFKSVAKQHS